MRGWFKGFIILEFELLDLVLLLVEFLVICRGVSWFVRLLVYIDCITGILEVGFIRGVLLVSILFFELVRLVSFFFLWLLRLFIVFGVGVIWLRMSGFVFDLLYLLGRFRKYGFCEIGE